MADFEIRTNNSSVPRRKKSSLMPWILASAVIGIGLAVGIAMLRARPDVNSAVTDSNSSVVTTPPLPVAKPVIEPADPAPNTDDSKTLWASPTSGPAISLAWLPTGCQCIIHCRPAALLTTGEGEKVLAALGPDVAASCTWLEGQLGVPLGDIASLTIGLRAASDFIPEWTIVVIPQPGATLRAPEGRIKPDGTRDFVLAGDIAFFGIDNSRLVIAPPAVMADIVDAAGTPPPLRRELQIAVDQSDADRHLTVLVAPSFLFGEGRGLFAGSYASLQEPLMRLFTDDIKACAASLNWSNDFFIEWLVVPTGGTKARELARRFDREVSSWPATMEETVVGLSGNDYGRKLIARLPAMLRMLSQYTRVEESRELATFRCYLPKAGGHNLLMASELLLAQQSSGPAASTPVATAAATPRTFEAKMQRSTSLAFDRDTLEMAITLLSEDTGLVIELGGGDLQLEGITKNQSFGLNEQNKPAQEILVTILRLANPDKTATGPADLKQKLVYVVRSDESLLVTTRAAAEKRGEQLPVVFIAQP